MPPSPKYDRRTIWKLGFIDGKTSREIAEKLGMLDYRVAQRILRERATEILRPQRPDSDRYKQKVQSDD